MSISFFYYSIKFGSYPFLQAQKYKKFRQCADVILAFQITHEALITPHKRSAV